VRIIIVTPLPSGVTIAAKIKKKRNEYLQFSFQKLGLIIPRELKRTMNIGNIKTVPIPNIRRRTIETNS
jgi:hypothetical protein